MKQLHYKLSAAMLAVVIVLGAAFFIVDRYSVRVYYQELTQRLNASLAMYVVNAEPLISAGAVNTEALATLAERAMIINPTAEIYLLGRDGTILGHAVPAEEVTADRVDLEPVLALLSESRPLPITGVNPRNPATQKIFSAFPVTDPDDGDQPAGYLYAVLGGAQYEAVAAQVLNSDRQRMVAASILLLVVAAFVAGTALFALLTRRLRRLTTSVSKITSENFSAEPGIEAVERPADEIDQLRNACHLMERTIQQQLHSLQENEKLRRELFTNISHDLRTPLASMQGYIETLIIKDQSLTPETRTRYLEIARKHALHLGSLIQDLFELAMLDSDRVTPKFDEFPLIELVYDVAQEFELQAKEARIELQVSPPSESVLVNADLSLIQRVLENLVGNALKHTPQGGTVTISVQPAPSGVGVSVADSGRGIPKDALPFIFDRFYKNDSVAEAANGSTGLGLAIAKRILELHGSEIRVVSEERQGTRFDFDLAACARAA
jgi:signal transduction histidine kinase